MFQAKKIISFLILFLFLNLSLVFLVSAPKTVLAGNPFDPENQIGVEEVGEDAYGQSSDPKDPREIVANIIEVILGFLAIIFVGLIIWSGFEWMTAGGNEEKVGQAKKRLKNSVIGLIIILMAYGITYFVTEQITDAAKQPWEW
ncbi:MAG TPA: pilin [Patescibacteria group bacterium]|nr:pilin [Patescibacteria group bacterium]